MPKYLAGEDQMWIGYAFAAEGHRGGSQTVAAIQKRIPSAPHE